MRIDGDPRPPPYRAVILTALPLEFQAVRAHLRECQEEAHPEGTIYERGRFSGGSGLWEVLLVEVGAGNLRAASETERALEYFSPHVALFVGVAGGLKDVSLGDVVFATKVYGYESGKSRTAFEPRPDVGESSYLLEQRARANARKGDWLRRIIGPASARVPRTLAGPIAAGEKVLAETRSELYQFLRAQYGDALAVEMEGRGFLVATRARRRVEALVIRGISDCIDAKAEADASGSQELAARHASAFAFELLSRFTPSIAELLLPEPRTEEHGVIWSVPYPRNPNFTGRQSLLQEVREHFLAAPARPQPLALHGLGGVGKTQLALEYACRQALDERHYTHVLWVRADDPAVLATSYAALSETLELPEKSAPEQRQKIVAVQQWLQRHEGWLLIIDNAEQPGALASYLPPAVKGHVLITSRNPAWGRLARAALVDVLGRAEAVEFLRKRTGQDDPPAAMHLTGALGGLPLALEQAAAYIEQTGKSLTDYLRLFKQRHQELLIRPGAPPDYPHTVAATWSLSFEQVHAQEPAGAALLSLCSFLAPTPIPIALLAAGASLLPESLAPVVTDEVRRDEVIGTLRRYSLVQVHQHYLLFHRLVQVVMRERLEEEQARWARTALGLIHRFFIFDTYDLRTWSQCSVLLPHAMEVAGQAGELETGLELLPGLLAHVGSFWQLQAEYEMASHVLDWGLEVLAESPAPQAAQETHLRHRRGMVALQLGSIDGAQEHLEHALKLVQEAPQEEERQAATTILFCDMAALDMKRGQYAEARAHAERALALAESTVPGNHPLIGQVASILGSVLQRQACFDQARTQAERALSISQENFGLLHPKTAEDLYHLAEVLEELGGYGEARARFEQALEISRKLYGLEHPIIANILRGLAGLHRRLGDLQQALTCCENALRIDEQRLGPAHHIVGVDLNDLAGVLQDQGDLVNARAYLERALILDEQTFGPMHPEVATALDNLGRVQQEQGEREAARASFERALTIHEQTHGPEHPNVARVLNNLGVLLTEMKDFPMAMRHLERALAMDERFYGPSHHEVALDLSNLASALIMQGDKNQGGALLQRALSIYDAHNELPASEVLTCVILMGKVLFQRREWAEARSYLERALQLQKQLKSDVQQRIAVLLTLGDCLRHLESYPQAVSCLEQARALLAETRDAALLCSLLTSLGACYRELDQSQQARASLEAALPLAEEAGNEALLSHARFELGRLTRQEREWQRARTLLDQVWDHREEVELERPDLVLNELGLVLEGMENLSGARARFEEALRAGETLRGPESQAVAVYAANLGRVLLNLRDLPAAHLQLERARAIWERLRGASSLAVAEVLQLLAQMRFSSGQLPEAEADAKRALSIYSAQEAPPAQKLTETLIVLGGIHWRAGALQEAQASMERALSLQESEPELGEGHLFSALFMLGDIFEKQKDLPRAKDVFVRALKLGATQPNVDPLSLCKINRRLGDLYKLEGELRRAHACYESAVSLHPSLRSAAPLSLTEDYMKLANACRLLEVPPTSALRHVEHALLILERMPPEEREAPQARVAELQANMLRGEILLKLQRWPEARTFFEKALESSRLDVLPLDHLCNLHQNLASSLMNMGMHKRAMLHFERALPLAAKAHGTEHPEYAVVVANIGYCLLEMGKGREAIKKLKRALAIFEQHEGPEHPQAPLIRQDLAELKR
ncbi:FxSxx-COOH system tetratricopeptide repeat protein [Hyalangium rubrum]|uniref:FxSxx-COOH system tetratricopeptide repeat protein n=1 Tax=Hyalangium rubrum TaxID=3103134 RepID=A0ABU5GVW4_9BACT|nr:FxSxx-COOH system tetratricopeptide repeat protein [Hyalangium sp. s54d21]MDY7225332.1 FxSxx-COOH system tetratricopeptide repeat protein [Hyalangium sp. s54d21]